MCIINNNTTLECNIDYRTCTWRFDSSHRLSYILLESIFYNMTLDIAVVLIFLNALVAFYRKCVKQTTHKCQKMSAAEQTRLVPSDKIDFRIVNIFRCSMFSSDNYKWIINYQLIVLQPQFISLFTSDIIKN